MRGRIVTLLLAAACVAALAACGSSGGTRHGSRAPDFLAFSRCMRGSGVTNFPDPSGAGGGIDLDGTGINPTSPAFQAAQTKCQKLLPGGGPSRQGPPSKQAVQQMVNISRCMRAHGVTGFPDPTLSAPANPGDYAIAEDRGGVFLGIPRTIDVSSPVFQRASSICGFGPGRGNVSPAP